MSSGAYNDPQYTVNMGAQVACAATTASTVASKFVAFAQTKIHSIRGGIKTAGTNTAAGYEFLNGTTTVGSVVCSTGTAGSKVTGAITAANATLAAGDVLDFKTLADSATLAASFVVEYSIIPGADVSAD